MRGVDFARLAWIEDVLDMRGSAIAARLLAADFPP